MITALRNTIENLRLPALKGTPEEQAEQIEKLSSTLKPKQVAKLKERLHREKLRQLKLNTEQQNKELSKKLRSRIQPKNTVDFIAYEKMFEDGICEVEKGIYSKTIKISDINYQTARRDEQDNIFIKYCEILNSIDSTEHIQISILDRKIDSNKFRNNMYIKLSDKDNYDKYRIEMNRMLAEHAIEGKNTLLRDKYVTFSTPAQDYNQAKSALIRLEEEYSSSFKALGCDVATLSGIQRLEILHAQLRAGEPFYFNYDELVYSNLTTKQAIAPAGLDFTDSKKFKIGDKFGQVSYIRDLPAEMSDKLISELTDLPIDLTVTLHIDKVDHAKALERVRQQLAYMEMEQAGQQEKASEKGRTAEISTPMEVRRSYHEAKELLFDLENNSQRMFKVTILIYTYADTEEELNANFLKITTVASKNTCTVASLNYRQREGLNSSLVLGENHVDIKRTLTTASTAIFIPFTTQELFQEGGMYYGLNSMSRNLIFFNRYSLKAPNGVILGTPGSGKSFAAKREMINVLLTDKNAEVIVIDPEREYMPLAKAFDGENIRISAGSKNYINPMDITENYADEDDPLMLKSEFILTLCELLIGGRNGLTPASRSLISRVCTLCYQPYFANPDKNKAPTLKDFYNILKAQPEDEANSIALSLEIYIDGTLSVFANETNVDSEKRFIVYDIRDLGKQLRTLGMLIVLDQIWNRVTRNRSIGKRTWIYIDEFQLLLNNEYSATYFFELWSRSRKWGAIPTGITQNVETLLLSDLARRMLSNSDFIMMLNQSSTDRHELAGLLNMSNKQMSQVTNTEAGKGLLFAGKSIVPFTDSFPKDTELYKMMTTKIEEVVTIEDE